MEAWPHSSIELYFKSSNPRRHGRNLLENFSKHPVLHSSKLLTKTSQNFLRKLLKTSNPPLLVMKTSYQNFSKLPILHFSLRKLPIPPLFVTKTSRSSTFGYETTQTSQNFLRKLLTKTSQNFQSYTLPILSQSYENFLRKLPIPPLLVTKT